MTDEDDLLLAIREHPEEDVPRLMYADWCDEHDQPDRATFIRAQIELARTPARPVLHLTEANLKVIDSKTSVSGLVNTNLRNELTGFLFTLPIGQTVLEGAALMSLERIAERLYRCNFLVTGEPDPNAARVAELTAMVEQAFGDSDHVRGVMGIGGSFRHTHHRNTYDDRSDNVALFTRGFISDVTCSSELWMAKGDAIRTAAPVTDVVLTSLPGRQITIRNHWDNWLVPAEWTDSGIAFSLEIDNRLRDRIKAELQMKWSGIRFTLTPPTLREAIDTARRNYRSVSDEGLRQLQPLPRRLSNAEMIRQAEMYRAGTGRGAVWQDFVFGDPE